MKHKIYKFLFGFLLISVIGLEVQAQLEKNEVYLFTCPIADAPTYQQIALKYVTVLEQGGQFQYFVMDVEAGNENQNLGEGDHLKYVQTLLTTQNAEFDRFVMPNRNDYLIEGDFRGFSSSIISVDFLKLNDGSFELNLDGRGALFNNFLSDFEMVMRDSNLYSRFEKPTCTSHPNLRNYLD